MSDTVFFADPQAPRPCAVYLVDAVGLGLVYVGIADDFEKRWQQHRRSSWWLNEVIVSEVSVFWMGCREHARQIEASVIHHERPRYNTAVEAAAYARYLAAATVWPVRVEEIYDGEGELQWASV